MGRKVNGISVSDTPKIGERPYPSPFHPVEITPKTGKNPSSEATNHASKPLTPSLKAKIITTLGHKYHENTDPQVLVDL